MASRIQEGGGGMGSSGAKRNMLADSKPIKKVPQIIPTAPQARLDAARKAAEAKYAAKEAAAMKKAKQPAKVKVQSRRAAEVSAVAKKKRAVVLSLRPNKQNI